VVAFDEVIERLERRAAEARACSRLQAQAWLLEQARFEHAATGNPLAVWVAWRLSRRSGLPAPEWVLAYFDAFAELVREWIEKPPAGDLARAVGVALGFGSARKDQNRLTDWRERREGKKWFLAFEAHVQQGLSPTRARREVAREFNTTEATVRRRLERFAEGLGTTPEAMAAARLRNRAEMERQLEASEAWSTARLERALRGLPYPDDAMSDTRG
jgi:hypothetical protein